MVVGIEVMITRIGDVDWMGLGFGQVFVVLFGIAKKVTKVWGNYWGCHVVMDVGFT